VNQLGDQRSQQSGDGAWAGSQPWIVKGERSGLLARTAMTESVSLFLELERAIYCFAVDLIS